MSESLFSFRVLRNGQKVGTVEAVGMLSALVRLGTTAEDDSWCDAEWTVERIDSGSTTFQWLIERGQPEGEMQAVWLENSAFHTASDGLWTTNANDAAMFPDRATCEAYIADEKLEARAVEHGFMTRDEEQHGR